MKGNREYFEQFNQCMNNEVGHAIYCYFMEVNTDKFSPQFDMPLTDAKKDALVKRMHSAYVFLKENYIFLCECPKCLAQSNDPNETSEDEDDDMDEEMDDDD